MSTIINSLFDFISFVLITIPSQCFSAISALANEIFSGMSPAEKTKKVRPLRKERVAEGSRQRDHSVVNVAEKTGVRRRVIPKNQDISISSNTQISKEERVFRKQMKEAIAASLKESKNVPAHLASTSSAKQPSTTSVNRDISSTCNLEQRLPQHALNLPEENLTKLNGYRKPNKGSPELIQPHLKNDIKNTIPPLLKMRKIQDVAQKVKPIQIADEDADLKKAIAASLLAKQNNYVPQIGRKAQVGPKVPTTLLGQRYDSRTNSGSNVQLKIENLSRTYKFFQPIAGDGNCFYTAFAMDFLLNFVHLTLEERQARINQFSTCRASSEAKRAVVACLHVLSNGVPLQETDLLMLQIVECLRMIGSQYIQNHEADFPCSEELTYEKLIHEMETMGSYAKQPMIEALVKALNHPVRIISITSNLNLNEIYTTNPIDEELLPDAGWLALENGESPRVLLPEEEPPRVLIYRGDHYDLAHKN